MIPDDAIITALHRRYAPNQTVFDLVYTHCTIVNQIAQWCANRLEPEQSVDRELLRAACLLHDIGTYICFDDNGKAGHNRHNYKQHAIFGAALALEEGFDPKVADAIRTHVIMGLSKQEIIEYQWALPHKDYLPETIEGELLCYADRFHSKHPTFTGYDTLLARFKADLPLQADKFEASARRFGLPDIAAMVAQYGHPLR